MLFLVLVFHGAYSSAQEPFVGAEDSLAAQPELQRLGKEICKCWKKEVSALPKGPKFLLERFSSSYESYIMDVEDYYNHDTTYMRLDGEVARKTLKRIQECISDLHGKRVKILDEYNHLELYSPLQLYFDSRKDIPGLNGYFEAGVLSTHPDQHLYTSIIAGLLNSVRGNDYDRKETGIDRLTDRMKSIIRESDGDTARYKELLSVYKSDTSGYYEGDMQIMELYVFPHLDEELQIYQARFKDKFGVLDRSVIDDFFEMYTYFGKSIYQNFILEKSLIQLRLSQK